MNIDLSNRVAWVGGSTQGLGKAIAHQLAESGATVVLVARNEEKLKALLSGLATHQGQNHSYLLVDFNDFESYKKIVDSFFKNHQIDILVNNTQGSIAGNVWTLNDSNYQEAFQLLFQSVVYTTMKALEAMKSKQYGRIINACSVTVKEPLPHLALSNSIRSALVSWAKTLASEVAKYNVTVNSILTGYFDTERLNEVIQKQASLNYISAEDIKTKMMQDIPAKRFGFPAEYGNLVAFLASDKATYLTGTTIPLDGGLLKSF